MSEIKEKKSFLSLIKENKKIQIFLIVVLCLGLLVFVGLNFIKSENTIDSTYTIQDYVTDLENKLSNVLSKVEGAGKVSVVITVESGMETEIARTVTTVEKSGSVETVDAPLVVNGKTVVLKENYPKITGVLIVCQGGNNIGVLTKIQQATMSLLDIELNQINILCMK